MASLTHPSLQAPASATPWAWAVWSLLLGVALATLVYAPARWLQHAVLSVSGGQVVLDDSRGTVWQGSAQLALAGGAGSHGMVRLPGRVQWQIQPGLRSLSVRLRADCCTEQAQVLELHPGWGQWSLQVQPGQSHWPAEVLAGLGTPWNTVQLRGNLLLSTSGLRVVSALQRVQLEGGLTLDLPRLSSRLSTLQPLGSYQLRLTGGEPARLELRTLQGSLQLQGQGQWTAGRLHFEGAAQADAAHEAELSNLLNIMGRRDGARSVITLG